MSATQEEVNQKVHEFYEIMSKPLGDPGDLVPFLAENFDLAINCDELYKIEQQSLVVELGKVYFKKYVYEQPEERQQKSLQSAKIFCQKMEQNKFPLIYIGEILKRYGQLVDAINPNYEDEYMKQLFEKVDQNC